MGEKAFVTEPEILIEEIRTSERVKVGILGGTFNPPHLGHLIMAEQVKSQLDLDKIFFMPTAEPPHSSAEKKTISADKRLKMVELATIDNPDFEVEHYEINRGGKNYTYDTMKALIELYPTVDFYFIVGGDMIADMPTWYRIDELVELVQFVGVNRPGYLVKTDYPIIMVDIPMVDISSTTVRKKVAVGCSIKYLVPENVEHYIGAEGLYQNDEHTTD